MLARRRFAVAGLALLSLLVLVTSARAGLRTHVRSESVDGSRLIIEVELPEPRRAAIVVDGLECLRFDFPGLAPEGAPGEPELSVGAELLAVPPGGSARLRVLEAQIDDLGRVRVAPRPFPAPPPGGDEAGRLPYEELRWDGRLYEAAGARTEAARLGPLGRLRHQQVVTVEVRPLLYDATTLRLQQVRRLTLQIDLVPGSRTASPAGPPARLATSPAWERIYGGALLNARSAAAWRRTPPRVAPVGGALKSGLLRPGLLDEDEWKIRVDRTGPVRVAATALFAAGFPQDTPVGALRLVLRRFDAARPLEPTIVEIPILVQDGGTAGVFDAADTFLFYGENVQDDATSEDALARYDAANVYWLSVAASGTPAPIPVRAPLAGAAPGPSEFLQNLTYEEDRLHNPWVFRDTNDLYYWQGQTRGDSVTVPAPGRIPGSLITVCVETQESQDARPFRVYARGGNRPPVFIEENLGGGSHQRQTTCGTVIGLLLDPGDITISRRPFDPTTGLTPYLDLVRLEYRSTYVAAGDRIRCTSGGAVGPTAFAIGGFTATSASALRAFDITDPKAPAAFDLTGALSGGTLTLTDDVPAGVTRVYLVVPDAGIAAPLSIVRDGPSDLLDELASAPLGTYDALVVANDRFLDDAAAAAALDDWRALREAQGHRLRFVRTSDVYDAFRGGLQHYEAIHRAAGLAYENWGIEFLILVGDGSEDARGLSPWAGPNLVPAPVAYFNVPSSTGPPEFRNDMYDKYYAEVSDLAGDWYPDLLIGRLPVADATELRNIVDKLVRYDTPLAGDDGAWRKRVVGFADDDWVRRPAPGGFLEHRRGCSERFFETSVRETGRMVEDAFPGDFKNVLFPLREWSNRLYTDRPPGLRVEAHRPVPVDSICVTPAPHTNDELGFYVGTVAVGLADSVGEGALFLAVQSHANRVVVSDEAVMSATGGSFAPTFSNDGKPFVFFGFGCHLNEYGDFDEDRPRATGGDALGERLVTAAQRGAIASYASTGYEFLTDNTYFHEHMWDVIFNKRYQLALGGSAVDPDTIAARWLLSELLQISEITTPLGARDITKRYVLLGDPMLRLDGGVPRVRVDAITNGFLQSNNRLVVRDRTRPVGFDLTLSDEQGIDSLWVVRRYAGGVQAPIDSVTTTALLDTLPQVRAKRSYRVVFEVDIDQCNFEVVVGARDLGGRTTEFVARVLFDQRLMANGVPVQTGDRIDARTLFRFEVNGCDSIPSLPLQVFLNDSLVTAVDRRPTDSTYVNWKAEFTPPLLAQGSHTLRFDYAGEVLATYTLDVGGVFGMAETIVFPNPMRKSHRVTRIYFHLGTPIAGGWLRILDVNGRTVRRYDLRDPGIVKSDLEIPAGSIGTGVGQDDTHWNWVEWDGRDRVGDLVANGVYLYELQILDSGGKAQRKRDKLVVMR